MNRRDRIQVLRTLHQICAVKRADMEMQVERSNAHLRHLDKQFGIDSKDARVSQEGWRQAVSGQSFQLVASAFWSAEILRVEAALQKTSSQIEQARAAHQDLYQAQTRVMARCDVLDGLLHSAARTWRRQQDEAALETHALRASSGWGGA